MNDKANPDAENAAGLPEPDPPKGGPDAPEPADLAPGFGGTSATRPVSTEEDETSEG